MKHTSKKWLEITAWCVWVLAQWCVLRQVFPGLVKLTCPQPYTPALIRGDKKRRVSHPPPPHPPTHPDYNFQQGELYTIRLNFVGKN